MVSIFLLEDFYVWPATNTYYHDEESFATFVQVEETAGQSQ